MTKKRLNVIKIYPCDDDLESEQRTPYNLNLCFSHLLSISMKNTCSIPAVKFIH